MAHPLRLRLLALINDGVATPKELAAHVGEPLENVSYHIRVLREAECIELVSTEQRRGATAHFYRAVTRAFVDDAESATLDATARGTLTTTILQECFRHAFEATAAGTFDARDDRHLSYTTLELTAAGWDEITERLAELLDRALALHAEGLASASDEPTMASDLVVMHFPAPR